MSQHYSYKQSAPRDDTALYMRDYNTSIKTKKILARISLVLLLMLFFTGFLLSDIIGDELSAIMMIGPVILMVAWFLVVLLYKGEPPPTFDPPIDINKEFGKHYFQSPETIQKEEASSRTIRLPRDASLEESIVKVVD